MPWCGLPHWFPPALLQAVGFLLDHPVAALAVGGGAAILIPRLVRAGVRFVLVPAALLLAAYIAFSNPAFVWTAATGAASGGLSRGALHEQAVQ